MATSPTLYSSQNFVIGGTASVHVGAAGATVPQTLGAATTWDNGWTELGFTSEAGIQLQDGKTIVDVKALQSFYPVMKIISERQFDLSFTLEEWTQDTFSLAFGGGSWSNTGGAATWTPPSPGHIDLRSLCVDIVSQGVNWRLVAPIGLVSDAVQSSFTRTAAAVLPIKFTALGQNNAPAWYAMTDDPNFGGTGVIAD